MKTYKIQLETITEYQTALHSLRNWSDQKVAQDGDNLTIEVTELGLAMVESSINRRLAN